MTEYSRVPTVPKAEMKLFSTSEVRGVPKAEMTVWYSEVLILTTFESLVLVELFVHAATRGATCASTLKKVNTPSLIKNSPRDDRPSIST